MMSNLDSTNHNINYYTEGISYYSFVLTSVGAIAGSSGISGSSGTSAQPLTELSISIRFGFELKSFLISNFCDPTFNLVSTSYILPFLKNIHAFFLPAILFNAFFQDLNRGFPLFPYR